MKNSIVITDSGQFEEIISSLENSYNKIKDIINKENKNAEIINETETWTGACARSMYSKYKELNSNYNLIDYSLDIYIKFLKKTLEDYRKFDEEVSGNLDNLATELDVHN